MGANLGVLAGKGTHLNKFLYFCTRYSEQYPLWVVLSQYKDNDILCLGRRETAARSLRNHTFWVTGRLRLVFVVW